MTRKMMPILAGAMLAFVAAPAAAAKSDGPPEARPAGVVQEVSAQSRRRPRILVYPRRGPAAWTAPRPGIYSYPGPGAIRQCADWYTVEYRPSGTVMTPQMRCWWVR